MARTESSASSKTISQPAPTITTEIIIDDDAASTQSTTQRRLKSIADRMLRECKPYIEEMTSVVNAAAEEDDGDDEVIQEYKALLEEMRCTEAWARAEEQAQWWARVKRQREEEEAREFKRFRYELQEYMRELEQQEEGVGPYCRRPYWWADYFVDDEDEDDKILEIYD